ncbi:MAG: PilZ domain-containing protein [Gammaproteobacteria bacterium]
MEHRLHPRVPTDIGMLLYNRGVPVATGRIRNASRGGLLIETGYADLREFQSLEFEFCAREQRPPLRHRVGAHVLRRVQGGVALEIDDRDGRAPPALAQLMGAIA